VVAWTCATAGIIVITVELVCTVIADITGPPQCKTETPQSSDGESRLEL